MKGSSGGGDRKRPTSTGKPQGYVKQVKVASFQKVNKRSGGGAPAYPRALALLLKNKPIHPKYLECMPCQLDIYTCRRYGPSCYPIKEEEVSKPPLRGVAWGWNSDARSGNVLYDNIEEPRQVQKSHHRNFISCAAGLNHSLLVDDKGAVYSFGSGRRGQLGYGNIFNDDKGKGGITQAVPRAVTPSGAIKYGADMKIAQVGCGAQFSVAREVSSAEALDLFKNLRAMEHSIQSVKHIFYDSEKVQKAWAEIRQERYRANRIAEGRVCTWGTGNHGQLGLGNYVKFAPAPTIIPKLNGIRITQISTGLNHVLAISAEGKLYSWGSGKSGKLGHKNFDDLWVPRTVLFFEPYYVEYCCAGDNHSCVLITNRKGPPRDEQLRRVSAFGRGAHGRLGNGTNRNSCVPVLVTKWLPSSDGVKFIKIACGGAHTLVLGTKPVKKCLANPWGVETYIAAWGYGKNGQLGTGYTKDSFVPVKVRMPNRCELIREIDAGRSWSLATSIGGVGYSWGKGLRGQLGQDRAKSFSLVPRKIRSFVSFVKFGAGTTHNLAIGVSKKFLNDKISVKACDYENPLDPLIDTQLEPLKSDITLAFNCCKRYISEKSSKSKLRLMCKTCNVKVMCYVCSITCHKNHEVYERLPEEIEDVDDDLTDFENDKRRQLAGRRADLEEILDQSMKHQDRILGIRRPATKQQQLRRMLSKKSSKKTEKKSKNKMKAKMKGKKEKPKDAPVFGTAPFTAGKRSVKLPTLRAVEIHNGDDDDGYLQTKESLSFCRCGLLNQRCRLSAVIKENPDEKDEEFIRKTKEYVAAEKIQTVARLHIGRGRRKGIRREIADLNHSVSSEHFKNKIIKTIMNGLTRSHACYMEAREMVYMQIEDEVKRQYDYKYFLQGALSGMNALAWGFKKLYGSMSAKVPRVKNYFVSDLLRPSLTFSWASLRATQLKLKHHRRLSTEMLCTITRDMPRYDTNEGQFFDADVALFTNKVIRSIDLEKFRANIAAKEAEAAAEKQKRAEMALAVLMAARDAKNRLFETAAAVRKAPPPPRGPPPRSAIIAAAREAYAKREAEEEEIIKRYEDSQDSPFDVYGPEDRPPMKRRHSISDPSAMYSRIATMRPHIFMRSYSRRRNSLPDVLSVFHPEVQPQFSTIPGIVQSLDMFWTRMIFFDEIFDVKYKRRWDILSPNKQKRKIVKALQCSWLNPRLPSEMMQLLLQGERRRTVGEPERLARHLHVLFEARNNFSKLKKRAADKDKLLVRRRSFDLGEEKDNANGINGILGYEFEAPFKPPNYNELRKDLGSMEKKMIDAGMINTSKKEDNADPKIKVEKKKGSRNNNSNDLNDDVPISALSESMDWPDKSNIPKASITKSIGLSKINNKTGLNNRVPKKLVDINRPVIWQEHFSDEGHCYYYQPDTGDSSWDMPEGDNLQILNQYQDDEGNWYWYNSVTGEASWV